MKNSDKPSLWRLKAKSVPCWQKKIKEAGVCLGFGFGILRNEKGEEEPGTENTGLFREIVKHSKPEILYAQQAILLARPYVEMNSHFTNKCELSEMHVHDPDDYYDTIRASEAGLQKIADRFPEGVITIGVFAHRFQLQRAVWILYQLRKMNPRYSRFKFIIPETGVSSFSAASVHRHTRSKFIYLPVELFISRPRDFFTIQYKKIKKWKLFL